MAVPKGFWIGANAFFEQKDKDEKAAELFLAEQLSKTKSIVLPELLTRLSAQRTKRSERKSRVSGAQLLGFSERTAIALEKSGQLEAQLTRIAELNKSGNLDADYVSMLDKYVTTKIDNDEDLSAAIGSGLSGNSFISEEDQMEGLILAMHSTSEDDFSRAVELLQPPADSAATIDPFGIGITKGRQVTENDRRKIHNRLGKQLAANLNTRVTNTIETPDGEWLQFADPSVDSFLSEMVDSIVHYETDIGTQLSRNTLVETAEDLVQIIPAALVESRNSFGSVNYGLPWAQKNFASVFKGKMLQPDIDNKKLWEPFINTASPDLPPCPSGQVRNRAGVCEVISVEPSINLPPDLTGGLGG